MGRFVRYEFWPERCRPGGGGLLGGAVQSEGGHWSWIQGEDDWVPPSIDLSQPSIARIYDYWLGGKDNYPVDREVADRIAAIDSGVRDGAWANRRFLVAAVQDMAR